MGYLYRLDFANDKSYIGITAKSPESRFNGHIKSARSRGTTIVYKAWRKYGQPALMVLAKIENYDLKSSEIRAIREFNTKIPHGYNSTDGGDGCSGLTHSEETRKKISIAGKGRPKSAEHRAKIGAANTGRKPSPAQIEKYRVTRAKNNKPVSDETRANLSAAHKGKNLGNKFGCANKGKVRTATMKLKISIANTGRPAHNRGVAMSDAQKLKVSIGRKAYFKNKKRVPHTKTPAVRPIKIPIFSKMNGSNIDLSKIGRTPW